MSGGGKIVPPDRLPAASEELLSAIELRSMLVTQLRLADGGDDHRWYALIGQVEPIDPAIGMRSNWQVDAKGSPEERAVAIVTDAHPLVRR